jgi:IS30 family transposase
VKTKIVAVNERGLRVGEDHAGAKLTDAECDLIRTLHEEGMSYRQLAEKFDTAKSTIADIVKFRRRCQHAVAFREVRVGEG